MATGSSSPQAIDKLCKKARTLLSTHAEEARRIALDVYQRMANRPAESLSERRRLANVLLLLARCVQPNYGAEAARYASQALAVVKDVSARQERAEALFVLAMSAWTTTRNKVEALDLLQQSRTLVDDGGLALLCEVLCEMGSIYAATGDFDNALVYLEQCTDAASRDQTATHQWLWRAFRNIGNIYGIRSNHVLAIAYYQKSLSVVEQYDPNNALSHERLRISIGGVLLQTGNYDQALEYWLKGLALLESHELHPEIAAVASNIGMLYKLRGQYDEALSYLFKALEITRVHGITDRQSLNLQNIASVYIHLHKHSEALSYAMQSYECSVKSGNKYSIQYALHKVGRSLVALGREEEGLQHLYEGYNVSREIRYESGIVCIGAEIGLTLGTMGRPEEGLTYALAALELATQNQQQSLLLNVYRVLTLLYEKLSDYANALFYHKAMHTLETTIANEESMRRIEILRVLHQVEETRKEAELYKLQTAHLRQHIEDQKRMVMSKAVYSAHYVELLSRVKTSLLSVEKAVQGKAQHPVQEALATVNSALLEGQSLNSFEDQFQYAFMDELQRLYPKLSKVELRVCSLLRLDLSSKEICRIMNIAPRSVDMYRYRIRKKLNLPSEANIASLLASVVVPSAQ